MELAALTDAALVPQALAAVLDVREEADCSLTASLAAALRPERAAAGAGQLRAPDRSVRLDRRCPAARLPGPVDSGDQSADARHGRRDDVLRALALAVRLLGRAAGFGLPRGRDRLDQMRAQLSAPRADRSLAPIRGGPPVRRAGPGRRAVVRADGPQRRVGGEDLPAPGRDPARDRAGGGAGGGAQPGADRGSPGRPVPLAVRWEPDGPAALPDAARPDRLEPRPARRAGADRCCAGSRCSRAAGPSTPPSRSARATGSSPTRSWTCSRGWWRSRWC